MWEFLWLIDKVTEEVEEEGVRLGLVLGGAPVLAEEIGRVLDKHSQSVRKNLARLEAAGYIRTERRTAGLAIMVLRSVKWIHRRKEPRTAAEWGPEVEELLTQYRLIPGVRGERRDADRLGAMAQEYGAPLVAEGLMELGAMMRRKPVRTPLAYLAAILQRMMAVVQKPVRPEPKGEPAVEAVAAPVESGLLAKLGEVYGGQTQQVVVERLEEMRRRALPAAIRNLYGG